MIFILTFFNIFHKCHLIYRRYLFLFSLNSDQAFRKKAKKVDDFFKSFNFYFYLVGFDWPSLVVVVYLYFYQARDFSQLSL